MKLQEFLDSGCIGSKLDKLKGSSVGINIQPETREVTADSYVEQERQKIEKLAGRKVYQITKGASACFSFFHKLGKNSPNVIHLGNGYYEIQFEDFSIFNEISQFGWTDVFMDAREVILPLMKTVEYASSERGYVFSISDDVSFYYYFVPKLKYPKATTPFLEWLRKKKKIVLPKGKISLWNKNEKIDNEHDPTIYDTIIWYHRVQFLTGVPMKNIKFEPDLANYNLWLKNTVIPKLAVTKKKPGSFYRSMISCPDHVDFNILDVTQDMIDEYIVEANSSTYKVLR